QIGYWPVKIVTAILEAILVIGLPLVELLRGSASVRQSTLPVFIVFTLLYCRFLLLYLC
ncbi:cytochrome b6, partial [Phtheirospermum japonicum]